MTTRKKTSVLPIYLVGFVWLGYALLFPLHRASDYLICAGLSLAAFAAGKAIFPDKVYQAPGPAQEPKKEEKADPQVAALRREKDRAISELRRLNDAIPDEKI